MTKKVIFSLIAIIITIYSCKTTERIIPDKNDPFQERMRIMNAKFKGIYLFFEQGFNQNSVKVIAGKKIIIDTTVSTRRTSQLAFNASISSDNFSNQRKLTCVISGMKYNVSIKKEFQNIRISLIEKNKIQITYDNNFNLYE